MRLIGTTKVVPFHKTYSHLSFLRSRVFHTFRCAPYIPRFMRNVWDTTNTVVGSDQSFTAREVVTISAGAVAKIRSACPRRMR